MGYSAYVVGVIYCFLPILSLTIKPIVGAVVDQFRVKKTIFLTFILLTGLAGFALIFVPEIPLETKAELHCHTNTFLKFCPNESSKSTKCDANRVIEHSHANEGPVNCQVNTCVFMNLWICLFDLCFNLLFNVICNWF